MTLSFARHQFPPAVIRHAVRLYMRFTLNYRDHRRRQARASSVRFDPLSCSPFQAAGANILLLAIERFKSTAVRQGKRHDHENDG